MQINKLHVMNKLKTHLSKYTHNKKLNPIIYFMILKKHHDLLLLAKSAPVLFFALIYLKRGIIFYAMLFPAFFLAVIPPCLRSYPPFFPISALTAIIGCYELDLFLNPPPK